MQKYLADHGFATPRVRLWASPTAELDSAWMLMDLVDGEPLMPSLESPRMLASLPRIARSLPDTLARCSADLHRVPVGDLALQWDAIQGTSPARGDATDDYLHDLLTQAAALDNEELARFAESLQQPRDALDKDGDPQVICHGDLQPFNVLVSSSHTVTNRAPAYVTLDWSTARIANHCNDLAYTSLLLSNPPLAVPGVLSPIVRMAGRFLDRRFLRSYERFSGLIVNREHLDWFVALHALRVMIDVATWKHEGTLEQHSAHPYLLMDRTLRAHYLKPANRL